MDESGEVHDEVQLGPMTGRDEHLLAESGAETCAATFVTELLVRCVKRIGSLSRIDASVIRDLLVGDRDYLVIKLRQMILGSKVICVLRCPNSDCGKLMDLTFNLDELEFEHKPVSQRYFIMNLSLGAEEFATEGLESSLEFRLPNGADQEACAALSRVDGEAAVEELLARCIKRIGDCTVIDRSTIEELGHTGQLDEIEERMAQLSSRAEIELEARCPECGQHFNPYLDALTFFLDELRGTFVTLEHDIHFLAWHYHWSEQEILSMTRRKRQRYVTLLQKETDRLNHVW